MKVYKLLNCEIEFWLESSPLCVANPIELNPLINTSAIQDDEFLHSATMLGSTGIWSLNVGTKLDDGLNALAPENGANKSVSALVSCP